MPHALKNRRSILIARLGLGVWLALLVASRVAAQTASTVYLPWVSRHAGPSGGDTVLAQASRALPAGSWAEIQATGLLAAFTGTHGGATGNIAPYSEDLVWDPTARLAYFLGGDHIYAAGDDFPRFVRYTDDNNTWEILPAANWYPASTSHGYDHSALDPDTGIFYHRAFNSNQLRIYSPGSGWTTSTPPFSAEYGPCCDALEYFPALGGVIWVRGAGEVWRYAPATGNWDRLAESLDVSGTWLFAAYNPVRNEMVFGSAARTRLYRLAANGGVTPLKDLPIQIYDGSGYAGDFTVDPVSGLYLALTAPDHALYTYDSAADVWTAQPSGSHNPALVDQSVLVAPIDTYGVIGAVACHNLDCSMWIYKHTQR